jgi:hypothetical protein
MHGELSYVFVAGEFAEALIQLGQARRAALDRRERGRPVATRSATRLETHRLA